MADTTLKVEFKMKWWVPFLLLPLARLMGKTGWWSEPPRWLIFMTNHGYLYRTGNSGKWRPVNVWKVGNNHG